MLFRTAIGIDVRQAEFWRETRNPWPFGDPSSTITEAIRSAGALRSRRSLRVPGSSCAEMITTRAPATSVPVPPAHPTACSCNEIQLTSVPEETTGY
jgi:hypothetical protein